MLKICVIKYNAKGTDIMKNILEYLEKTANEYSKKIAIMEEDKNCNYIELLENSKKVGSGLLKYEQQRKPVPILLDKGIETIYAFFGVLYAGAFYVLLNPELPISRLKKILETLDSNILITNKEYRYLAKQISCNEIILDIEDLKFSEIKKEKLQEIRNQSLDVDPLYANFTSGSTGSPKGVVISHQSVLDFIEIFTNEFNINSNDIIGNQAPFDFDVSVKDIYSCIRTGATLVIIPKKMFSAPAKLLDYICENNVTTLIWAVSALCLITTFHGLDYKEPKTINKILFSGEVMPVKHLKEWIKHLPEAQYVNLYGPTEITCNCTYHIIDKNLIYEKQIPIGQAFDNEQIILLDEKNKIIEEINQLGEICVKGSALGLGYYNDLEQTNEKFIQNPLNTKYRDYIYKTGDIGYWGNDNNLYFSGRKDFQIKHMGHRIELEEIEMIVGNLEEIERVCIVYLEEKNKICVFYIGNISKNELRTKLKEILPVFMMPNIFMELTEFPITKNGKIDRKKLKQLLQEKTKLKGENDNG